MRRKLVAQRIVSLLLTLGMDDQEIMEVSMWMKSIVKHQLKSSIEKGLRDAVNDRL